MYKKNILQYTDTLHMPENTQYMCRKLPYNLMSLPFNLGCRQMQLRAELFFKQPFLHQTSALFDFPASSTVSCVFENF